MKKLLLLFMLLLTFGFVLPTNAAELTVTGEEAKDVNLIGEEMMKAAIAIAPCFNKYSSKISDKYQLYYTCICKNRNTIAISSFKKTNEIIRKHPKWSSYSSVKVIENNGSSKIDLIEQKKIIKSINSCLR